MKKYINISLFKVLLVLLTAIVSSLHAQNINRVNVSCQGGLFVNSFSGNLFTQRQDLFIPYRNLNLDFSFSYNTSNSNVNRGFGRGWSFMYDIHYRLDSAKVIMIWGDGREDLYAPDSTGELKAPKGIFDSLVQYQAGKYLLQTNDGMKYFFDNASVKKITKKEDPNGNKLLFGYTDTLLTTVSDDAGRSIQLQYNSGRLIRIIDNLAPPIRNINYLYDAYGNLIKMIDPMGNAVEYEYILNGPISKVTDKNGNGIDILYNPNLSVKEVISCVLRKTFTYNTSSFSTYVFDFLDDGDKQITIYRYTPGGNLVKKEGNCCGYNVTYEYDENNNISKLTDANGNNTIYSYDANGNLLSLTDPASHTIYYTYESSFSKISSVTDKNGNTTTIQYDNKGNPTLITEPLSVITSNTYNLKGDLISTTDPKSNLTNYEYDVYGNLTAINMPLGISMHMQSDIRGRLTQFTDANGHEYKFEYDALGRNNKATDPNNNEAVFAYDNNGNLTTEKDRNNHLKKYDYDAADRLVGYTSPLNNKYFYYYDAIGNLTGLKDPLNHFNTFEYDHLNRLTKKTNGAGEATQYSYDEKGNLITVEMPSGRIENMQYDELDRINVMSDALGEISSYSYDAEGNVISVKDALDNTYTFQYDQLNRLIALTNPLGNSTYFEYDKNYNQTKVIDFNGKENISVFNALNRLVEFKDKLSHSTFFSYDANGNQTTITDPNGNLITNVYDNLNRLVQKSLPLGYTEQYEYFPEGNLKKYTKPDGNIIRLEYDADDNITKRDYPDANDDLFTYNAIGLLINAANLNSNINITYDAANRVTSESLNGKTTNYSYNIPGRTFEMKYPNGKIVQKVYDTRQRLTEVTEDTHPIALYTYNENNLVTRIQYPENNTEISYSYDNLNRTTSILSNPGNFLNLVYSYDNNNNILSEKNLSNTNLSMNYSYDDMGRLLNFKQGSMIGNNIPAPEDQITYTYDALGNRVSQIQNGITTNYTTNSLNQYIQITTGGNSENQSFDPNGNLVSDGVKSYLFNFNNKLVNVNNGAVAKYTYDALGRRITKIVQNDTISTVYSGYSLIEEYLNNNLSKSKIEGEGLDKNLKVEVNSNSYYLYSNIIGSTYGLKDNAGAAVEKYSYEPFGSGKYFDSNNDLIPNSAVGFSTLFSGKEMDTETDNYYFRERILNSSSGRFNSMDPLSFVDGLNMYSYVRNNPINFIDQFGLQVKNNPESSSAAAALSGLKTDLPANTCSPNDYKGPTGPAFQAPPDNSQNEQAAALMNLALWGPLAGIAVAAGIAAVAAPAYAYANTAALSALARANAMPKVAPYIPKAVNAAADANMKMGQFGKPAAVGVARENFSNTDFYKSYKEAFNPFYGDGAGGGGNLSLPFSIYR
jgi:RHS repeat-associated protein